MIAWADLRRFVADVPGWMPLGLCDWYEAVEAIHERHGITGDVCEIGVYHGRSFLPLRRLCRPGETAVAVDAFRVGTSTHSGRGDRPAFVRNHAKCFGLGGIRIIEADSLRLTPDDLGGPFRVVSIDGGHSEEVALHDLQLAAATLRDGGIVIVDDYSEKWPGVVIAVDRFVADPEWRALGVWHGRIVIVRQDCPCDWSALPPATEPLP